MVVVPIKTVEGNETLTGISVLGLGFFFSQFLCIFWV